MRGLGIILKSLAAHRTRALLAMLGVFLGALALTAVMHVAGAMVLKADLETQKLGPNLLQALSGQVRFRRDGPSGVSGVNRTFTLQDAEAILGGVAQVRDGVPYCNAPMPVRYGSIKTTSQLVATLPGFARVRAYSPAYGRFISDEDEAGRALVCVLGTAIATRLFERPDNAVGRTVFFFRAPVQVVGTCPVGTRAMKLKWLRSGLYSKQSGMGRKVLRPLPSSCPPASCQILPSPSPSCKSEDTEA